MISRFRKGVDNLIVKIILGIIALSFLGLGGASFINDRSMGDIVSFSDADSISYEKFQTIKAREIDFIQKQNGISLTDENIAELDLNNTILRRLVNDAMISYLAKYYKFDISENKIISYIKNNQFFQNENGQFDLSRFKAAFNNSPRQEEAYIKSKKQALVQTAILNIFMNNFVVPKIMTGNVINYMAETRTADLLKADLNFKSKSYKPKAVSQEELRNFYEENKGLFITPELRSFQYLKVNKEFIQKKINFDDKALKIYFEENINNFNASNFTAVKKQVKEAFISEKTEELIAELVQNLEEDVSSGLTFTEIADKYALKIREVKNISLNRMNTSSQSDYIELADTVFEIADDEISYPIEVPDKSEILLAYLTKITIARDQEFFEVKEEIRQIVNNRGLKLENLKKLEELRKNYNGKEINKKNLASKGITVVPNQSFTRSDLATEDTWPVNLLKSIYESEINGTGELIIENDKAYFAYLKHIKINKDKAVKLQQNSSQQFANVIKEGVFNDLINYLTKKNHMKMNKSLSM
jgi:hypothetical protein